MSLRKLQKASKEAVISNVQHLMLIVSPGGGVQLEGSHQLVQAVLGDALLHEKLQEILTKTCVPDDIAGRHVVFDKLPCPPSSKRWKGSQRIRSILVNMLSKSGYGSSGTKKVSGQGLPPEGWRNDIIAWANFKGASKSGLTNKQLTEIIVGMLRAKGIDPETYIEPLSLDEDTFEVTEDDNIVLEEARNETQQVSVRVAVTQET